VGAKGRIGTVRSDAAAAPYSQSAADTPPRAEFAITQMPQQRGTRAPPDPRDPTPPPENFLRGYIDEASCSRITGWVWDPKRPQRRIALELVDGDTRLAKVLADQYRPDLRQAGIRDGRHFFTVPVGQKLLPSTRNVLHLRCAETGMQMPGSPVIIERSLIAAAPSDAF
jgi:hypothetical protein